MFFAAGLIYEALGHDRIAELGGVARALPITVFAFAIAGMSLMGLPPSGGFSAKWLLLMAAADGGQWWWAVVIGAGGLVAAAYVFRVIGAALGSPDPVAEGLAPVSRGRQLLALTLALGALLLGFVPLEPAALLAIGRGVGAPTP